MFVVCRKRVYAPLAIFHSRSHFPSIFHTLGNLNCPPVWTSLASCFQLMSTPPELPFLCFLDNINLDGMEDHCRHWIARHRNSLDDRCPSHWEGGERAPYSSSSGVGSSCGGSLVLPVPAKYRACPTFDGTRTLGSVVGDRVQQGETDQWSYCSHSGWLSMARPPGTV